MNKIRMIKGLLLAIWAMLGMACVQKQHQKTVTFRVDMNAESTGKGVGIRGEFSNPPWSETLPLLDNDNDGVYEITLKDTTAFGQMEFKFVSADGTYELPNGANRKINFEYRPETLVYEAQFNNPQGEQSKKEQ